jgi:hypothetical protein
MAVVPASKFDLTFLNRPNEIIVQVTHGFNIVGSFTISAEAFDLWQNVNKFLADEQLKNAEVISRIN